MMELAVSAPNALPPDPFLNAKVFAVALAVAAANVALLAATSAVKVVMFVPLTVLVVVMAPLAVIAPVDNREVGRTVH
jgi:membrane protein implicated in regulation of membrane protease activity